MNTRAAWGAPFALALVLCQYGVIHWAPSEIAVRIVLPGTIALVPVALWPYRHRAGVWMMFVGLAANLAAILANGGLMPIERTTVAAAAGEARAARYASGEWMHGSKDVLLAPGSGRLIALGDSIVIRGGGGGLVASPGDLVVWAGLAVLAGEASLAWQRRSRREAGSALAEPPGAPVGERAEGGAATSP